MEAVEFIRSHAMALPVSCEICMRHGDYRRHSAALPSHPASRSRWIAGQWNRNRSLRSRYIGEHRPIADFFAELGKLLLVFTTGLEIELALFRRAQRRCVIFGILTTSVPLVLGAAVGLRFGYDFLAAILHRTPFSDCRLQRGLTRPASNPSPLQSGQRYSPTRFRLSSSPYACRHFKAVSPRRSSLSKSSK
jgi:hypothetical protein